MALLNPVYGLIVPFLFFVTIPLAILAGITTTLAFSVLMFRVALVYVDIAVNMVSQYVAGRPVYPLSRGYANASSTVTPAAPLASNTPPPLPPISSGGHGSAHSSPTTSRQAAAAAAAAVRRHRRRRTSGASFNSIGSVTPTDDHNNNGNGSKRSSVMLIPSSVGIDRDFEGVGGWRLDGKGPIDDEDAWTHINSRLSLPLDHHWRHHHRSPSGAGTATPGGNNGGEYLMMKSPSGPGLGFGLEERSPEHGTKRGRERREKDGSTKSSGGRTPTKMLPALTMMDGADGSYFPRVPSPRAEREVC